MQHERRLRQLRKHPDRRPARPIDHPQHRALGRHRGHRRRMVERRDQLRGPRVALANLDPDRPLRRRRRKPPRIEIFGDRVLPPDADSAPRPPSSVASATPSSSFLSRVSTLPRNGTTTRSGRCRSICAARRIEDEPSRAPCGNVVDAPRDQRHEGVPHVLALEERREDQPLRQHRRRGPCSNAPRDRSRLTASAASISRENSPLPPASLSGASLSRSPLVVITRISTAPSPHPCASQQGRAHKIGLHQRQRRAARPEPQNRGLRLQSSAVLL